MASVLAVTTAVFKSAPLETARAEYLGGLILTVDTRYLAIDDHELEHLLVAAFPRLQSISKRQAGVSMQDVISRVSVDVPDAIPIELQHVMFDLLNRPSR